MTYEQRRHVRALERREQHLASRIESLDGPGVSYDRAERAAIRWALRIIRAADAKGVLDNLDTRPA